MSITIQKVGIIARFCGGPGLFLFVIFGSPENLIVLSILQKKKNLIVYKN